MVSILRIKNSSGWCLGPALLQLFTHNLPTILNMFIATFQEALDNISQLLKKSVIKVKFQHVMFPLRKESSECNTQWTKTPPVQ